MTNVPAFATVDPANGMTEADPGRVQNLVGGNWLDADHVRGDIIDPMNGEKFLVVPETRNHAPFIAGLKSCPKSGMHNPLKEPDRYIALGAVCAKAAELLRKDEVRDFFTRLIQRPRSSSLCRLR